MGKVNRVMKSAGKGFDKGAKRGGIIGKAVFVEPLGAAVGGIVGACVETVREIANNHRNYHHNNNYHSHNNGKKYGK